MVSQLFLVVVFLNFFSFKIDCLAVVTFLVEYSRRCWDRRSGSRYRGTVRGQDDLQGQQRRLLLCRVSGHGTWRVRCQHQVLRAAHSRLPLQGRFLGLSYKLKAGLWLGTFWWEGQWCCFQRLFFKILCRLTYSEHYQRVWMCIINTPELRGKVIC